MVNLLECLCYHAHAVGAVKDASLDLTDYCARRLAALHSRAKAFRELNPARNPEEKPAEFADKLKNRSAREELEEQALQIEFTVSVSCVALVRMVCEHVGELTVAAVSRIVDKHDFLLSVIPLIEHPPWTRARQDGTKRIWQKLDNGEWTDVPHDRLLDVTKLEAQAWFALYWLSMHQEIRKRYGFDAYRKQTLLRARRFVNDVLLDQIPVLADLQRFMDELAIVSAPEPTAVRDRSLVERDGVFMRPRRLDAVDAAFPAGQRPHGPHATSSGLPGVDMSQGRLRRAGQAPDRRDLVLRVDEGR